MLSRCEGNIVNVPTQAMRVPLNTRSETSTGLPKLKIPAAIEDAFNKHGLFSHEVCNGNAPLEPRDA